MTEKKKSILFLVFIAAVLVLPVAYLSWSSYQDYKRVSGLLARVQELAEQDGAQGGTLRLITGRVVAPEQASFESLESQTRCVASAAIVTIDTGRDSESGEVLTQQLPAASKQVDGLKFVSGEKTFHFDIGECDLGLWQNAASPSGTLRYLDQRLPDYLGPNVQQTWGDHRSFVVDEYLLQDGEEVTFLAEVDGDGNLRGGEFPLTLLPGSQARFVKAVQNTAGEFAGESLEGILVMGFAILFISVFFFVCFLGWKYESGDSSPELPGWVGFVVVIVVLGLMAAGARLPQYLDTL